MRSPLPFLVYKRWQLTTQLGLSNRRMNRVLRPIERGSLATIDVAQRDLELTSAGYRRLLDAPALAGYRSFPYVHTKPLEYLTTATLLGFQDSMTVMDAAGGANAEYLNAIRERSGLSLKCYTQDAQQSGQTIGDNTFVGGSIDSVPLPDGFFDAISCHHSIEHFRADLDIRFVREVARLLKPGGRAAITPLFLADESANIWNRRPQEPRDDDADHLIVDRLAAFCGWGPYEGFARVYSAASFTKRIVDQLPPTCTATLYNVRVDGALAPDLSLNKHQPAVNGEMKALLITRN